MLVVVALVVFIWCPFLVLMFDDWLCCSCSLLLLVACVVHVFMCCDILIVWFGRLGFCLFAFVCLFVGCVVAVLIRCFVLVLLWFVFEFVF